MLETSLRLQRNSLQVQAYATLPVQASFVALRATSLRVRASLPAFWQAVLRVRAGRHLRIDRGTLYINAIMDLYNAEIVACEARAPDTRLCLGSLQMLIDKLRLQRG